MGLRYRKSVNVGLGFRVNFSKSGIGYSWGGKGFRFTKTATGRNRTTLSIPGTGVSWVKETGGKRKKQASVSSRSATAEKKNPQSFKSTDHRISVESMENADVSAFAPAEFRDFLKAINKCNFISKLMAGRHVGLLGGVLIFFAIYNPLLWIPVCFFFGGLIWLLLKFRVNAYYEMDEYGEKRIELIRSLIETVKSCENLWQVNSIYNSNPKSRSGAAYNINRYPVQIQEKQPHYLRTNVPCYCIKLKGEQLYILPDKLLIEKNMRVGALDWKYIKFNIEGTIFIEDRAPSDTEIIGETWKHVNKDGSRDRRFSDNHKRYKCKYGMLEFKSEQGLNTMFHLSNLSKAEDFISKLFTYISKSKKGKL